MKLLLLLLCFCAPVFAQSVTISGVDQAGNLVALTPSTVIELSSRVVFQSTLPSNWTRGEAFTVTVSFEGLTFGASGNAYMSSYTGWGLVLPANSQSGVYLKAITQEYPATLTVTFANGGTDTEEFTIAP